MAGVEDRSRTYVRLSISDNGYIERARYPDMAWSKRCERMTLHLAQATDVCCNFFSRAVVTGEGFSFLAVAISAFMPRVSPTLGLVLISGALSQN